MILKKLFVLICIIVLVFPYSFVHAVTELSENVVENEIISEDIIEENDGNNEDDIVNTVSNEVVEETTNEIIDEVENVITNEITNEVIDETENEIVQNVVQEKEEVINEVEEDVIEDVKVLSSSDLEYDTDDGLEDEIEEETPYLTYKTHIQNRGWEKVYRVDGEECGTTGSGLRLEALEMNLNGISNYPDSNIVFSTYVESVGWNEDSVSGEVNGSMGRGLRLEAFRIELTGSIKEDYSIYYRAHFQNYGWLSWTSNGEITGRVNKGVRMESLQIMLVKNGDDVPSDGGKAIFAETPIVSYTTHVQNIGWQKYVSNGARAGTSGKGYRLEGIKIKVESAYEGDIEYAVHVQNIGDQASVKNDEFAGTSGRGFRLERIWIRLTGELAEKYDVYYRVHSQNYGDLDWAKNGELSGTEGFGYRLEAIEIKLVEKGKDGPTPNSYPFHKKYTGTITINNISDNQKIEVPEDETLKIIGDVDVTDPDYKLIVRMDGKAVTSSTILGDTSYESTINIGTYKKGTHTLKVEARSKYNDVIKSVTLTINLVPKTYVGTMSIESPFDMEVATIPDLETNKSNLTVKGWAISDDTDAVLNLYIDDTLKVSGMTRTTDYVADVSGYDTAKEKTEKQGFTSTIDIEKLSIGTHTIRIEMISKTGDIIDYKETRFQINRRVFEGYVNIDTPISGYISQRVESNEVEVTGWMLNTDPNYSFEIWYDDVLVAIKNTPEWSIREDVTVSTTGLSEELVNSVEKPGFSYVLTTDHLTNGKHTFTVKTMDRWGNVVGEASRVFRIEECATYGVDLSYANDTVNWDKLSEAGVSFAIIRIGYYKTSSDTYVLDTQFERNYEEAKKRNIKLGGYVYSYAFNGEEGKEEAEKTLPYISGKSFELPIFLDIEDKIITNAWGTSVTRDSLTDAAIEFGKVMESAGYQAGVYANKTWLETRIDVSRLDEYDIWLANYTWDSTDGSTYVFTSFDELPTSSNYSSRVDIWQYTSTGDILGNGSYVDLNVAFKKYL